MVHTHRRAPGRAARLAALGILLAGLPLASHAQDWRAAAAARIDAHRKANLRVVVVDEGGRPVEGAAVGFAMKRHAFRFGSQVSAYLARDTPRADVSSGDLDFGEKLSALRVRLDVPQGALVESAFLQFTADKDDQGGAAPLTFWAVAQDDAPDFNAEGVSGRPRTTASVAWDVPAWTQAGERGAAQRSPDLSALVQEVVDRSGWQTGQHIAFVVEGGGKRSARTFDKDPDAAPRLVVTVAGAETPAQVERSADDAEAVVDNFFSADAERYRAEIERLFNYAALGNALKWRPWERDSLLAEGALSWLEERGLPVHGHVVIWSSWRWNAIPVDIEMRQEEPDYVRERAAAHVRRIMSAYAGAIHEWDVLNEPLHETDLEQIVGFDERVRWFQIAREADPDARLFVNEFDILENEALLGRFKTLVRDLMQAGAPIGGIGIQGHFLGSPTPPEDLVRRFASLAELGLPLQITEFDMSGTWPDETQARFMETALVTTFAEPSTTAFTMWGFWDGNHWLGNAPLFEADWTLKPSGRVWMDYVYGTWWTDEEHTSGADGSASVRGFKGLYDVTVSHQGHETTLPIVLSEDAEHVIALSGLTVDTGEVTAPPALRLAGATPNPSSGTGHLTVVLGAWQHVRLELFDVLGRSVWAAPERLLPPGEHHLPFGASGLAAGPYLVRVTARHADGTLRAATQSVLLLR